jgi:alkaline phosphatase D
VKQRSCLQLLLLLGALCASPARSQTPQPAAPGVTAGPLVGHVWDTGAKVWVQLSRPAVLSLEVLPEGGQDWLSPHGLEGTERTVRIAADTDLTGILSIDGLQSATKYEYRFKSRDGSLVPVVGDQSFRTTVEPGKPENFRLCFGSCASNWGKHPDQPIWISVDNLQPALFLFLGDNVYYDRDQQEWAHPEMMWARYRQGRSLPSLQRLIRHTPCYAIWDDHDYGPDDSDKIYAFKDLSLAIFRAYWPNPYYATDGMPGVWHRFTRGQVEFFMTDDRYYRDADDAPNDEHKTQLGAVQKAWLEDSLKKSRATFKVVVLGGQFLARYHDFESFDEYRFERNWLLDVIRQNKVTGVVFLTGDRHVGEVLRWKPPEAPYPLYEFTSSPLAAGLSPPPPPDDKVPDRVPGSVVMAENFGEIVFESMGTPEARLTFQHHGADGKPLGQTVVLKAQELQ